MESDRINGLLAQQYVVNLSRGNTPPPINDTIPDGGIDIGVAIANSPH